MHPEAWFNLRHKGGKLMYGSNRIFTALLLILVVPILVGAPATISAQMPPHLWSEHFGDFTDVTALGTAVDEAGNVFVTGEFNVIVDFGGGWLTSEGGGDIYVVKFGPGGAHKWSFAFGDPGEQYGESVAADAAGNVIVVGRMEGTVDFGGGPLTSAGSSDIFVAKFDGDGNHLWSQNFGDEDGQWCQDITVTSVGDFILTGGFNGAVDFGGGPLTSAGGADVYLVKFDSGGNHIWSQCFGDDDHQDGMSVTTDGSGNVSMTGLLMGTADFGGGPLTSSGDSDIFVASFDGDGNHLWSQRFGSTDIDLGLGIAADTHGNVLLTGGFTGVADFGGGPLFGVGGMDIYLAKFDGDGNHVWSRRFGGQSWDTGECVTVDGSNNVLLTGWFQQSTDFGGGALSSAGCSDIFVAKFDGDGNHLWSQQFGDENCQEGLSVNASSGEDFVLAGFIAGGADFGGGWHMVDMWAPALFVAKFGYGASPTLLESYSATASQEGVEISWRLSEAGIHPEFHVLRAGASEARFRDIYNPDIVQQNLSFTFTDHDCRPGVTYCYRVDVTDEDGRRTLFETGAISAPLLAVTLEQNQPNPFNPTTTISFTLPEKMEVNLSIYNVAGKLVTTVVNRALPDGLNEFAWDGTDANGNPVSSGVYLYRLTAGKKSITRKMVMLK
jgi:hypothetical protein